MPVNSCDDLGMADAADPDWFDVPPHPESAHVLAPKVPTWRTLWPG